jgi:hypothetical protein
VRINSGSMLWVSRIASTWGRRASASSYTRCATLQNLITTWEFDLFHRHVLTCSLKASWSEELACKNSSGPPASPKT